MNFKNLPKGSSTTNNGDGLSLTQRGITQTGFAQTISNVIKKGRYKHYKGGEYQVIDTVIHSETEETMVLYKPLYLNKSGEDSGLWVRPIGMFKEAVEIDNKVVPRFAFISESLPSN